MHGSVYSALELFGPSLPRPSACMRGASLARSAYVRVDSLDLNAYVCGVSLPLSARRFASSQHLHARTASGAPLVFEQFMRA